MLTKVAAHPSWRISLLVAILILGLITTTSAVYATYRTINLNDNAVDPLWQTLPVYTSTCSNTNVNDKDEIKNAWITNSDPAGADGGWYYFRIEVCAGPALSSTNINAAIQFDCNNDGDFSDPKGSPPNLGDRKILYTTNGTTVDWTRYLDGANTSLGGNNDPWASSCSGSSYHGERPTGANTNVEWGFQFCDLPPGCRGADTPPKPIHYQIGTADTSTGQVVDGSPILEYSAPPTAVTMSALAVNSLAWWNNPAVLWPISGFSALLLVVLVIIRRSGRRAS